MQISPVVRDTQTSVTAVPVNLLDTPCLGFMTIKTSALTPTRCDQNALWTCFAIALDYIKIINLTICNTHSKILNFDLL